MHLAPAAAECQCAAGDVIGSHGLVRRGSVGGTLPTMRCCIQAPRPSMCCTGQERPPPAGMLHHPSPPLLPSPDWRPVRSGGLAASPPPSPSAPPEHPRVPRQARLTTIPVTSHHTLCPWLHSIRLDLLPAPIPSICPRRQCIPSALHPASPAIVFLHPDHELALRPSRRTPTPRVRLGASSPRVP